MPRYLLIAQDCLTPDHEAAVRARFDAWLAGGGLLILDGGTTLYQDIDGVLVPVGRPVESSRRFPDGFAFAVETKDVVPPPA